MTRDVFLGPMLKGRYDPRIIERTRAITDWSFVHDGDLAVIRQRLANLGVNFYTRIRFVGVREYRSTLWSRASDAIAKPFRLSAAPIRLRLQVS